MNASVLAIVLCGQRLHRHVIAKMMQHDLTGTHLPMKCVEQHVFEGILAYRQNDVFEHGSSRGNLRRTAVPASLGRHPSSLKPHLPHAAFGRGPLQIEHQFGVVAAGHAQQHLVAGQLLFLGQQHVPVIGPSGQHRGQACSANALFARGFDLNSGRPQGFDNGLAGVDRDRGVRLASLTRNESATSSRAGGSAAKYSRCNTRPRFAATASRTACMNGPGPQA